MKDYYYSKVGGVRGVMVIVVGMDTATRVQILDQANCISHNAYTLRKGMNPIILPPAMGEPVKLRLKINLVSYPARAEGLVNMDNEGLFHIP